MAREPTYTYLVLSSALALVWIVLYLLRPDLRRETLTVSLGTMPLRLTEPLYEHLAWRRGRPR